MRFVPHPQSHESVSLGIASFRLPLYLPPFCPLSFCRAAALRFCIVASLRASASSSIAHVCFCFSGSVDWHRFRFPLRLAVPPHAPCASACFTSRAVPALPLQLGNLSLPSLISVAVPTFRFPSLSTSPSRPVAYSSGILDIRSTTSRTQIPSLSSRPSLMHPQLFDRSSSRFHFKNARVMYSSSSSKRYVDATHRRHN